MPSHKNSIHLPHPDAPLAGHSYPMHHLEQDDASSSLRASSADRIMIPCTKDISSMHQRDSTCLSDAFECDDFRMYDYKVRRCMRGRSHDWTDCPFAHPGEKARRRDPRKFHYSGEPCPDFRNGSCQTGDACEYAHGVFECWLHPARYRTQPCKDGWDCTRRVCFFAHSMQQLRHVAGLVEEPCMEGASVKVKSQAHELHPQRHDLRIPEGMCLLEESFKWMVSMGGSYEHEVGLSPQTTSSTLSSMDAYYANAGYVSEMLAMLPLPSRNISPFEAISTVGFSSSNAMGVPLQVPPSSAMFSIVTPWPFVGLSGTGVISQNVSSMYEQSSEPAIFAPASSLLSYTSRTTSEHSTHLGGQQAAAWQSLCKREVNGKEGQSTFNTSTYVSDMVHYGGRGDTAMPHSFMHISERRRTDANEVINELNGGSKIRSLTDKLCKFSSFNACDIRCLSSPTSTLAGPSNPSPFLSPPLSPLSTPSSETSNVFSLRDCGNVQADDISTTAYAYIHNGPHWKDLGIKHVSTDQCPRHSHHHIQWLEYGALPQCLELPSFSQHMSVQNKWIHPHNNWSLEDTYGCDFSQLTSDNMQKESRDRYGDESRVENTLPDLGWVHELVN